MPERVFLIRSLLFSLFAALTIAATLFYSVSRYWPVYIAIIAAHFFYTFFLLLSASIRTHDLLRNFIVVAVLVSSVDIVLSMTNLPISYTVFLCNYPPFLYLLPYVGSEVALGMVAAGLAVISRLSTTLAISTFLFFWLIPDVVTFSSEEDKKNNLRVAIVQTVLPQYVTTYPGISGGLHYWKSHLVDALIEAGRYSVDVAILPESSMPGFYHQPTPVMQEILDARSNYHLVSHHYVDKEHSARALSSEVRLWSPAGEVLAVHEKQRPIPFVEKQVAPGEKADFYYKGFRLTPFICSESLNTYAVRQRLSQSDVGIVMLNEAEIRHSALPELHYMSDKIRARELGKPFLRAANYNLSGYIDHNGKATLRAADGQWENLYVNVPENIKDSFFSKTYILQHGVILLVAIFIFFKTKKIKTCAPYQSVYIVIIFCSIYSQYLHGCKRALSAVPEANVNFRISQIDRYFPLRQLGVIDGSNDMEQVDSYVDFYHIPIKDIPFSRGIGVVNTIHGRMYITERNGNRYIALNEGGFITLEENYLDEISLSKVLWYTYKHKSDN